MLPSRMRARVIEGRKAQMNNVINHLTQPHVYSIIELKLIIGD